MILKKHLYIIILILLSFIPLFDLLHAGLPITHDGQDHVVRIANFYQNLKEGNIIPRWAANLNWGYGHPILMFLYPLPSYIASVFHFIGFSLIDSLKIVFGIAFVLSGVAMYLWMRVFLGEAAGFVAGTFYMFAPYRFVDLYVRGAIGEHVAFIFPPLICYFLLKLSKKYSYWYAVGGALALAGLILSHNAITLMFLPLIFFYATYLLWHNKDKKPIVISYALIAIFGFGISSFFWIPAFFEGKYTLRDIVTKGEYAKRFVDFPSFIFGQWSFGGSGQFTAQIGIAHWIMSILGFLSSIILYNKKSKFWIIPIFLFIIFLMTLFLMTSPSKLIWEKITIFQKFQFPWRFLSLTVFITALLSGFFISAISQKRKSIVIAFIICLVLFLNKDYWGANGYMYKPDNFFNNIYFGTTDTGESAPIWSVRFMEHPPSGPIEIIDGRATINSLERTFTRHVYEVETHGAIRIRENTLYFPGWQVLVDNREVDVEFQDPSNRGLMTFSVPKGKHVIDIQFSETKVRAIADTIALLSLVIVAFCGILEKKKLWRHLLLY